MRVVLTLSALLYAGAGFADDLYLDCTYSDGLHTKLAFLSNGSGLTFREGSMLIEGGKTDEFGGSGRVSQTPSALKVEYTIRGLQITTTVYRQSWQLVQSVVRSGVQTYRNAQCALSQP
ncbi:MAG: hypothetical protein WB646_06915 [Steroidobacteraceae bacterium]